MDVDDLDSWAGAVRKNTKLLYVETPTNPGADVIDLEWLGEFARAHKVILVVDNCFATPVISRPIEYGAHLSLHSATKYIDGQGRVVAGVVVGKQKLIDDIYWFCRSTGPALSPFNAWLLSRSLETLELRMQRHSENALELARRLEQRPDVQNMMFPFLPSHPRYEVAKRQMRWGGGDRRVQGRGAGSSAGGASWTRSACARSPPTWAIHARSPPIRHRPRMRA